jgi:hypothetical protein
MFARKAGLPVPSIILAPVITVEPLSCACPTTEIERHKIKQIICFPIIDYLYNHGRMRVNEV